MNSPSVRRTFQILRGLAESPRGLTLTEVAGALGLPKSSVHGILHTLSDLGCVRREAATGQFVLGLGIFELGAAYLKRLDLVQEFNEVAAAVVVATGETVQLAVLDGCDVIYVGRRDGTQLVRLASDIGRRLPAHATALGRALLAQRSDETVRALYRGVALQKLTPDTIDTVPGLLEDLAACRARGYAHDREETAVGVQCYATAIRNHGGDAIAAVSITAMSSRLTAKHAAKVIEHVRWAAEEISRRLGAPAGRPPVTVVPAAGAPAMKRRAPVRSRHRVRAMR